MKVIGMLTSVVIVALAVVVAVVGVKSAPDVQRYVRMRRM